MRQRPGLFSPAAGGFVAIGRFSLARNAFRCLSTPHNRTVLTPNGSADILQGAADVDFEWDPKKAEENLRKHGVDFSDAARVFDADVVVTPSDREGEVRWKAIGVRAGSLMTVIFTKRGATVRIISARKAHRHERREYREVYPGGAAGG